MNVMQRWNIVMLATLLGLTLALPASAQWKWRDKNGQTQYSDLPPPGNTPEKDILQRPTVVAAPRGASAPAAASAASAAPPALLIPGTTDPSLEARRKQAEQQVEQQAAEKKKAEDAKTAVAKADNCARAKTQMRTLESGVRLTRTNAKGEIEFLDDATRAAEAERTRSIIATDCS